MRNHLTTLLAVAMLGCAGHAAAQKAQPTVLTNEQLKTLLSKKLSVRITGVDRANTAPRSATSVYEPDGTARFTDSNNTVTGSWRIDGNKFCTTYTQAGSGCYNIQKTGEGRYHLIPTDSNLEANWQVVK